MSRPITGLQVVLRVPVPFLFRLFLFVLSSCRVPFFLGVSHSWLLFSRPCFPWWRILSLFCYFVLALHLRPRSLRASSMCVPLACCLYWDIDADFFSFFFFSLFLCYLFIFSISIWTSTVCFIQSFPCGYYLSRMMSISR